MARASYRFDEFVVDLPRMRLLREGVPVELEPKALLALVHFVENPHRLVTKQELLARVWADACVTDNSVTHAITQIRRALGDDARSPRFVETAHALGYRFLAAVEEETETARPSGGRLEPRAAHSRGPSLAVLPFTDMSPAHDQEYLCDGITEELINALTQLEGLRVAARTSSFSCKARSEDVCEIGRRLGVGAVLEGSVRRSDDRLRVTVQLVSVADGYHLWSERFDRTASDLFALQDEIALGVAERLRVELATRPAWPFPRRHEPHQAAHDAYLKGRFFLNRRGPADFDRAIRLFEEAIATDPAWALPHLGIAEAFEVLGLWGFLPPRPACERAKAAALRALELDDSLLAAHLCLANLLFLHDWNWSGALRHLGHARGAPPTDGYGRFVLAMLDIATGKPEEAVRMARLQVEAEPASAIAHEQSAAVLIGLGRIASAAELLEKALVLDAGLTVAHFWLGFCRGVQERYEEAATLLRTAADRGLASARYNLPAVLVRAGRTGEARATVDSLELDAARRYVSPVERLLGWAALGERQRCQALFAEAERERCPTFTVFVFAPGYLALAPDWLQERFGQRREGLLAEVRLAAADREARTTQPTTA